MKTIILVSDTHTNSYVGLSKPTTTLDDGSTTAASTVRRWLFHQWESVLEEAAKKVQGELVGVMNGDMVETDSKDRGRTELLTQNRTEAREYAVDVLTPLIDVCSTVFFLRGTEAHVGLQAQEEEAIASNFDNVQRDPDTGRATMYHLLLELEGVRLDIAHHPRGGGSGRPQSRTNYINGLAADALFDYANSGLVPPHLFIRSHLHVHQDSFDNYRTRAIITPAFSLLAPYNRRAGINAQNDVGAILIYCDNGQYKVEPLLRKAPRKQWVTI